ERMAEAQSSGEEHGNRQPDGHAKAVVQDDRTWVEMGAKRANHAEKHTAAALESWDRGRQGIAVIGLATRGDHRICAQRDRQVRDDTKGVIDIESVQHLLRWMPGAQLF